MELNSKMNAYVAMVLILAGAQVCCGLPSSIWKLAGGCILLLRWLVCAVQLLGSWFQRNLSGRLLWDFDEDTGHEISLQCGGEPHVCR